MGKVKVKREMHPADQAPTPNPEQARVEVGYSPRGFCRVLLSLDRDSERSPAMGLLGIISGLFLGALTQWTIDRRRMRQIGRSLHSIEASIRSRRRDGLPLANWVVSDLGTIRRNLGHWQ